MSNKRITIHLTDLEAGAIIGAIGNMWTGDGDGVSDVMKAGFRVEKKILEARRKRNDTTDARDKALPSSPKLPDMWSERKDATQV